MIRLNKDLKEILNADISDLFYLVQVRNYFTTDYFIDISVNGNVYQADGALAQVSAPKLGSVVDTATYRAEFADPDFLFAEFAENGMFGAKFEISVSSVKNDGSLLTPFVIFSGTVNKAGYAVKAELTGESLFVVEGGSPINNVDLKKPFRTSRDYLKQIDVTDTAFDNVYQNSGQLLLRWGK